MAHEPITADNGDLVDESGKVVQTYADRCAQWQAQGAAQDAAAQAEYDAWFAQYGGSSGWVYTGVD